MYRFLSYATGAIAALCCTYTALAQPPATESQSAESLVLPVVQGETIGAPVEGANAYGYNADDVAIGQGVVLYWYAHGYRNAFGCFPDNFAALTDKGLPLRKFFSPYTGEEIMPDDGTLDFDGDMLYKAGGYDVTVEVQTSRGVVSLPGTITATSDIRIQYDPCCCPELCGDCCRVCLDKCEDWGLCDNADAACKIAQWMMWLSLELHECLYGMRPADEQAWMASGLAPIDKNYKEYVPTMDIEYVYSKGNCCVLKKVKVNCCAPCLPCSPCKTKCGRCDKCQQDTCSRCKPDKPCGKCAAKCNDCKPNVEVRCKSKCGKCDVCRPRCEGGCKSKCGSCDKCINKCGKCDACRPKVESSCKTKCGSCDKCRQDTCSSCKPGKSCGKCQSKCGGCEKPGCARCK